MMRVPAEQRAFLLYYAHVLLREARVRRLRGQRVDWMLNGAARARREAAAIIPTQPDLFAQRSAR